MKKILSVVVALCMILAYSTALSSFAGSKATELNSEGYCVWHDNYIEVFFPNEEVAGKAAAYTFTGIAISKNTELMWNGGDPLQLSGNLSVTGTKGVFKLHAGHNASVKDVMTGKKTCWSKSFPTWAEEKHGNITLRIEHYVAEQPESYFIYYLPIYGEGEFDNGLHLTDAYFSDDNRIAMVFNRATGNVYGQEHGIDFLNHTGRYTAVRIVNNTTDWNLIYDGATPMQWTIGVDGYWANNILYSTVLGADSVPGGAAGPYASYTTFDSIKTLVQPGGKFEGCVVAFCIEETNNGANSGTVNGDGYVNCFFDESTWASVPASKSDCLKANRVVADQLDGAYVTMYDPNVDEYFNPVSITGARVVETAEGGANDYVMVDFNRPFDKFSPPDPRGYWPAVTITKDPSKPFDYELAWSCTPTYGEYVGAIGGFANIPLKVGACSDAAKELSTTGKNTTNINDILSLVKEGGAYEGYYLTVRIEETDCTKGNGYLDIFCDAMNGWAVNTKSNTTPLAGANDVSVFTICEPVSKTTKDSAFPLTAEVVNVQATNNALYVVFSEDVEAPKGTEKLNLVACGWDSSTNIERVISSSVTKLNDRTWKFTLPSADHKPWILNGNVNAEGPTHIDNQTGAYWAFVLEGDVKAKNTTKQIVGDFAFIYDGDWDNIHHGTILEAGMKSNKDTDLHVGVTCPAVATEADLPTVFASIYSVAGDTNMYIKFSEPVTLGADFKISTYAKQQWSQASANYFLWNLDTTADVYEKVDDEGYVYKFGQSAWIAGNTNHVLFNPTETGFYYTNYGGMLSKIAAVGSVTTASGHKLLFSDMTNGADNCGGLFHTNMDNENNHSAVDLTSTYTVVSSLDAILPTNEKLTPVTISAKDSYNNDGKIDSLYINAAVPADGTYGILFAENEFATEANLKLKKDGGNPLFTKICDKYDAVLQSGCYGEAEISATNLGGEIGDKVIALNWKNMPAYGKFAARMYKVLDNGTVAYGPVATVTLADGGYVLPID